MKTRRVLEEEEFLIFELLTSRVLSKFSFNSLILFCEISYPITSNFLAKAIDKGSPTYPKPMMPIDVLLSLDFDMPATNYF